MMHHSLILGKSTAAAKHKDMCKQTPDMVMLHVQNTRALKAQASQQRRKMEHTSSKGIKYL